MNERRKHTRFTQSFWLLFGMSCLGLTGCIHGYHAPAPDGYRGDFVIGADGATLIPCDIGPGFWSGSVAGTCIFSGRRPCETCTILPPGTPVRVLHQFVHEATDVSIRVGHGPDAKVAHTRNWEQFKKAIERAGSSATSSRATRR